MKRETLKAHEIYEINFRVSQLFANENTQMNEIVASAYNESVKMCDKLEVFEPEFYSEVKKELKTMIYG